MEDTNSDMFRDPGQFLDTAASLRHGAGSEFLEEARITEIETEMGRRRRWTLRDVWERSMHRGDRVVVWLEGTRISGTVDFVGDDFATIQAADVCWDVRFSAAALRTVEPGRTGHSVSGGSRTLKARLAEYASTGETVTILAPRLGLDVEGTVRIVATDHVVFDEETNSVTVPLERVAGVRRWV
jgi:hypothetical protein